MSYNMHVLSYDGFYIGDKVRITREDLEDAGWQENAKEAMDSTVGKIGTILEFIYFEDIGVACRVDVEGGPWIYALYILEKINEK